MGAHIKQTRPSTNAGSATDCIEEEDMAQATATLARRITATPRTILARRRQRALRQAVVRAATRFARQHPHWVAALFDQHFLTQRALPLFERYHQPAAPPTAAELAAAWVAQFPYAGARVPYFAAAVRVAADFLRYLEVELRPYHST